MTVWRKYKPQIVTLLWEEMYVLSLIYVLCQDLPLANMVNAKALVVIMLQMAFLLANLVDLLTERLAGKLGNKWAIWSFQLIGLVAVFFLCMYIISLKEPGSPVLLVQMSLLMTGVHHVISIFGSR